MVRLMLLERLLQNLPQLRNVGGVRAIPYMQVIEEGSGVKSNQLITTTTAWFLFAHAFPLHFPAQSQYVSPSLKCLLQQSLPIDFF